MGNLRIENLTIGYGSTTVIQGLNMDVKDGEIFSILGPSGTGKTTILKTVAGLLPATSGDIFFNGTAVTHTPPDKRDTVLIFQKPLLFPHLNVADNIGFGLKMQRRNGAAIQEKIREISTITGLEGLENRKIHQLSGGQQQRVALARGLVLEPSVLLLDEPLSNLDANLRQQMRELLIEIRRQTGTTMLFVTHDQAEAFAISDRVCLLLDGTARQTAPPEDLYYRPADPDVARFFGSTNILHGTIEKGKFHCRFCLKETNNSDKQSAIAVIRPEDIRIEEQIEAEGALEAVIEEVRFEGATTAIEISVGAHRFTIRTMGGRFITGQRIVISLPSEKIHIFPDRGGLP